jgi:hypothetical protein
MSWLNYREPRERALRVIVAVIGGVFLLFGGLLYYSNGTFWEKGAGVCIIFGTVFVVLAVVGKAQWLENI